MINLMVRGISHGVPSDENDIPARCNLVPLHSQPHCLAHPALDLISLHCFSCPPADGKTESTVFLVTGEDRHHQQGMEPGAPFTTDALKVRVGSQTVLLAHRGTGPGRHATGQALSRFTRSARDGPGAVAASGRPARPWSSSSPEIRAFASYAGPWAARFVSAWCFLTGQIHRT